MRELPRPHGGDHPRTPPEVQEEEPQVKHRTRSYLIPLALTGTLLLIGYLAWSRWPRTVQTWVSGAAQGVIR